ncbi:putative transmembrane protein [Escherichia phage JLBYU43]|uniref:Transmembrane protein n=1 Tax=Escherichia phage JLBYU43 TaxID=2894751 RepID=A0AAE8YYR4_9CAUD|nr:putative transmembrane protein [Escherichia phage JLBYU43]
MVIFRSILASILGAILSLFVIAFGIQDSYCGLVNTKPMVIIGAGIAVFSYLLGCMTSKGE